MSPGTRRWQVYWENFRPFDFTTCASKHANIILQLNDEYNNNMKEWIVSLWWFNQIFPVYLGMPLIFTDFQHCTCLRLTSCWKIENMRIWEPSSGILEKFQCSRAFPNIKYNSAVLFWSQLYWLFIYTSKYIFHINLFFIDTHTKIWTEFTDIVFFSKKLLKFLQGMRWLKVIILR